MGKGKFPTLGVLSFGRRFSSALIIVLLGCSVADTVVHQRPLPLFGPAPRWTGQVTGGDMSCVSARGVLIVHGDAFVFDPFESTVTIRGQVTDDGRLEGKLARPTGQGRADLSIVFKGRFTASGEQITGALSSGACDWVVTLRPG